MGASSNAQAARRLVEAVSSGDRTALRSVLSERVVWRVKGNGRMAGNHVGRETVIDALLSLPANGTTLALRDALGGDGHAVAFARASASGPGRRLEGDVCVLLKFDGAMVVEGRLFHEEPGTADQFW